MGIADRVFAKCAWRLIPFITLLNVVVLLDRVNVNYTQLTMDTDLGISSPAFNYGYRLFIYSILLFQLPALVLLLRLGTRRWMIAILAACGLLMAAGALLQGPGGYYVLRVLMGVAVAGFIPGMMYYGTVWFRDGHLAFYMALLIAVAPLILIVGWPIADFIFLLDGVAGLHGWQWQFLVECVVSFLFAFAILKLLPDGPASASWLSGEDKAIIAARLSDEESAKNRDPWLSLRDPRVYALGLVMMANQVGLNGTEVWLTRTALRMDISERGPVFVLIYAASIIAMMLWARSSDVRGERIWHVALPMGLSAAGLILASLAPSDAFVIVGLGLAFIGVFAPLGPLFGLLSSFLSGPAAASGFALVYAFGTLGIAFRPYVITALNRGIVSDAEGMMMFAIGLVLATVIVLAFGRFRAPRAPMARQET